MDTSAIFMRYCDIMITPIVTPIMLRIRNSMSYKLNRHLQVDISKIKQTLYISCRTACNDFPSCLFPEESDNFLALPLIQG